MLKFPKVVCSFGVSKQSFVSIFYLLNACYLHDIMAICWTEAMGFAPQILTLYPPTSIISIFLWPSHENCTEIYVWLYAPSWKAASHVIGYVHLLYLNCFSITILSIVHLSSITAVSNRQFYERKFYQQKLPISKNSSDTVIIYDFNDKI
jgi:hypothetical protein